MVAYIVLYLAANVGPLSYLMTLRKNKALRSFGIYTLRGETLILLKRSEELSFLFSEANWQLHGPVNYRVSHGNIYCRGESTGLTDEDLVDTGKSVNGPTRSILINGGKQ